MTDPDRISQRSQGLAAQLLRASAAEQPHEAGLQRTLAALGVGTAVVTTTSAASAATSGVKVTATAGASVGVAKAATATLLVKWIGIGVVGGIGIAGAAAAVSAPSPKPAPTHRIVAPEPRVAPVVVETPAPVVAPVPKMIAPEPVAPVVSAPRVNVAETKAPEMDVGAPLAAEVAYVDRARAALSSGQTEQGLRLLNGYERDFPEARLMPEVLFLQLEAYERAGRNADARHVAQRLLNGFPKSPHAKRAQKLLSND